MEVRETSSKACDGQEWREGENGGKAAGQDAECAMEVRSVQKRGGERQETARRLAATLTTCSSSWSPASSSCPCSQPSAREARPAASEAALTRLRAGGEQEREEKETRKERCQSRSTRAQRVPDAPHMSPWRRADSRRSFLWTCSVLLRPAPALSLRSFCVSSSTSFASQHTPLFPIARSRLHSIPSHSIPLL